VRERKELVLLPPLSPSETHATITLLLLLLTLASEPSNSKFAEPPLLRLILNDNDCIFQSMLLLPILPQTNPIRITIIPLPPKIRQQSLYHTTSPSIYCNSSISVPRQKLNYDVTFQISHYIYIYYYKQIVSFIILEKNVCGLWHIIFVVVCKNTQKLGFSKVQLF